MKTTSWIVTASVSLLLAGCRQDMHDQPKYKPLAVSTFFTDGRAARPVPPGTVAVNELDDEDSFHTGGSNGGFLDTIPLPVTAALLEHGQERFNIYCSPCHDRLGSGHGMIERRGFKIPADLNSERVREAPPGYIFQVISNGYGAMPDHRDQIVVGDRWAIVAYLRALELSRSAPLSDVPAKEQAQLEAQR